MRSLEKFRIPKHLKSSGGEALAPSTRLAPIFRDKEELSVHSCLAEAIVSALTASEFLIVICSPEAVKSKHVNLEITEFRKQRGSANILPVIVDGEPMAESRGYARERECFPPTLLDPSLPDMSHFTEGRVPLGIDMRPQKDSLKLVTSRLAARMLDIKLDQLLQRQFQYKLRRLTISLSATAAGLVVMSGLAATVWQAKQSEQDARQRAEENHTKAEELIQFMVRDLVSEKLLALGRPDIGEMVAAKARQYYEEQDIHTLTTQAIAQRARTLQELARISLANGDRTTAEQLLREAYRSTKSALETDSSHIYGTFMHVRSARNLAHERAKHGFNQEAKSLYMEALTYSEKLLELAPSDMGWFRVLAHANVHLGTQYLNVGEDHAEALRYIQEGFKGRKAATEHSTANIHDTGNLAGGYYHIGLAQALLGEYDAALKNMQKCVEMMRDLAAAEKNDLSIRWGYYHAVYWLSKLQANLGLTQDAKASLKEAAAGHRQLLEEVPDNTTWLAHAAWINLDYAQISLEDGSSEQVEHHLQKALPDINRLWEKDKDDVFSKRARYKAMLVQGMLFLSKNNLKQATQTLQQLDALLDQEGPDFFASHEAAALEALAKLQLGRAVAAAGDREQARSIWEGQLERMKELPACLDPGLVSAKRKIEIELNGQSTSELGMAAQ